MQKEVVPGKENSGLKWMFSGQVKALSRGDKRTPVCQVWHLVGFRSMAVTEQTFAHEAKNYRCLWAFLLGFGEASFMQPPPFGPLCRQRSIILGPQAIPFSKLCQGNTRKLPLSQEGAKSLRNIAQKMALWTSEFYYHSIICLVFQGSVPILLYQMLVKKSLILKLAPFWSLKNICTKCTILVHI